MNNCLNVTNLDFVLMFWKNKIMLFSSVRICMAKLVTLLHERRLLFLPLSKPRHLLPRG